MNRTLTILVIILLVASCGKESALVGSIGQRPIGFSAYAPQAVSSRAESYSSADILGKWDEGTSAFLPGQGIGIFAFYQKAKNNGYPVDFNKYTGEPTFMYNQFVERTTTDGTSYVFNYDPVKFWPNNENDQLSFFAYAPFDETFAWEDLHLESNLKGTKITREFIIEPDVEDQTDFIWANPVVNAKNTDFAGNVQFSFKHLCSRISVTAVANVNAETPYLTVDSLAISGKFNTSGTYVYEVATGTTYWENVVRETKAVTYIPFREEYAYNTTLGRDTSNAIRITDVEALAHPKDGFIFVLPGIQDITVSYVVGQRNPVTGDVFKYRGQESFPQMALAEGKAYNFRLSVELNPIQIWQVAVLQIGITEVPQFIP